MIPRRAGLLWLFLALPCSLPAQEVLGKGQRLFICGHSFNWFIAEPLRALAREAGYADHETVGMVKLGDSRPIDHWNVPENDNLARKTLKEGNVDILTLAPHREMPDRGIDLFADYACEHNPKIRVILQISWPDFPMAEQTDWNKVPALSESYLKLVRQQAGAINSRQGREVVTLVPVVSAVLELRGKIASGSVPGITSFGELFVDKKGHPTKALADLTTFCWFASVYQKSPLGLTALDVVGDRDSVERNRLFQQIAWDTVRREPLSGLAPNLSAGF